MKEEGLRRIEVMINNDRYRFETWPSRKRDNAFHIVFYHNETNVIKEIKSERVNDTITFILLWLINELKDAFSPFIKQEGVDKV